MSELDFLGAFFSVTCLVFFVRQNPWGWPISAIAIPFDILLYAKKGIYADMCLQIAYLTSTLYGWYQWCFGGVEHKGIKISYCPLAQKYLLLVLTTLGFFLLKAILSTYTHSQVVFLDALTTALSLLAQWLLCRKYIETWFVWAVTDVFYFYLYYAKGLPFHCLMVLVYFLFAGAGFFTWKRILNRPQVASQMAKQGAVL